MADERISVILEIVDKATPELQKFSKQLQLLNTQMTNLSKGTSGVAANFNAISASMAGMSDSIEKSNSGISNIVNTFAGLAGVTIGAKALGNQFIGMDAAMESTAQHLFVLRSELQRYINTGINLEETQGRNSDAFKRNEQEISDLQQEINTLTSAQDKHTAAANRAGNAFNNLAIKTGLALVGITTLASGIKALGDFFIDTAIKGDRLNLMMGAVIGGTRPLAGDMAFLKSTVENLGLEFFSTGEALAKFSAATYGTTLQGEQTRKVFAGMAEALSKMGKSPEEVTGALNAMGQMVSKGTVQMEELRGQLGDRLPGALQAAAKAMGVTTDQLISMVEKGEVLPEVLLPRLVDALGATGDRLDGAQQSLNRLNNEWTFFKQNITNSQTVTQILTFISMKLRELRVAFGGGTERDNLVTAIEKAQRNLDIAKWTGMSTNAEVLTERIKGMKKALEDLDKQQNQPVTPTLAPGSIPPRLSPAQRSGLDSIEKSTKTEKEKLDEQIKTVQAAVAAKVRTEKEGQELIDRLKQDYADKQAKRDEKAGKATKRQAEEFDNARDALQREIDAIERLTKLEQIRFETSQGKFESFSAAQKEVLLNLAKEVDLTNELIKANESYVSLKSQAVSQIQDISTQTSDMQSYLSTLQNQGSVEANIAKQVSDQMDLINKKVVEAQDALAAAVELDARLNRGTTQSTLDAQATLKGYQEAQQELESGKYEEKLITAARAQQSLNAETDTWKTYISNNRDELAKLAESLKDLESWRAANKISEEEFAKASEQINKRTEELKNGISELDEFTRQAARSMQNSLSDFFFDAMNGKLTDLVGSFKKAIDRIVADMLAAKLANALFGDYGMAGNKGNTGGKGLIGALGEGIGSMFGGFKAAGGPVAANTPYIIGEIGPELFIPKTSGTIIPNNEVAGMSGGGQVINNYISAMDSQDVMRALSKVKRPATQLFSNTKTQYNLR